MMQFFPSPDQIRAVTKNRTTSSVCTPHLERYAHMLSKHKKNNQAALPSIEWDLFFDGNQSQQIINLSPGSFAHLVDHQHPNDTVPPTMAHCLFAVLCTPVLVVTCAPHESLTLSLGELYKSWMSAAHTSLHIIVGSYAHVTIIDDRIIDHVTHISAIEIEIKSHAQVKWIDRSDLSRVHASLAGVFIQVHEHAHIAYCAAADYARSTFVEWHVQLHGVHSKAEAVGLALLAHDQTLVLHTNQTHRAPSTNSSLLYKGLITGKAFLDFGGLIHIAPDAAKASAHQENKNMLFSDIAHARSIPSLEALTNDVQCSHASATGHFERDHLLYMNSRGLSVEQAQQLLLKAFCNDVIKDLDDEMQQKIMNTIVTKIPVRKS